MQHPLYQQLLMAIPEKPSLSVIQERQPFLESWPVVLSDICSFRGQLQYFMVSDGTNEVICYSSVPDVQQKISTMELGAIIHVIGAETRFSGEQKCYVVDIQDICTLKGYQDRLKAQEQAEKDRIERLKQEGYWNESDEAILQGKVQAQSSVMPEKILPTAVSTSL